MGWEEKQEERENNYWKSTVTIAGTYCQVDGKGNKTLLLVRSSSLIFGGRAERPSDGDTNHRG